MCSVVLSNGIFCHVLSSSSSLFTQIEFMIYLKQQQTTPFPPSPASAIRSPPSVFFIFTAHTVHSLSLSPFGISSNLIIFLPFKTLCTTGCVFVDEYEYDDDKVDLYFERR